MAIPRPCAFHPERHAHAKINTFIRNVGKHDPAKLADIALCRACAQKLHELGQPRVSNAIWDTFAQLIS